MSPYVAFFLALVFVLFNSSTDANYVENQITNVVAISFKSLMPTTTPILKFNCTTASFFLPPQQTHFLDVSIDQGVSCHAEWNYHLEADIIAFDPKSDLLLGRGVYWIIRTDGLLKSLNNFNFEKKAAWGP